MKTWSFTLNNIFQKLFYQLGFHLKFVHVQYFFNKSQYLFFPDVTQLLEILSTFNMLK